MKRFRRLFRLILGLFALLLAAAMMVIGWKGSEQLVSPPRRALEDHHREILGSPTRFGLEIHPFTAGTTPCLLVTGATKPGAAVKSNHLRDELARRGTTPAPWGAQLGTIVMFYGHRGRKEDHLPICERFCAAGFRCLLLDIPAQGDHPAAIATFGKTEAVLAGTVLDEAATHFSFDPAPAFLFGVSQGGAIALHAAARSPEKWAAVASVATFASLDRPLRRSAESLLPEPLHFCCPLATFSVACGTKWRAGYWPSEIRPIDAAAELHLPVFIVHGDRDRYIGLEQGREIFAAVPGTRKQLRVVKGGNHGRVLAVGSHALYADLCQFFLAAME